MIKTTMLTAGAVALGLAPAAVAAAQAIDGDADLVTKRKLHLSAETRGADRVAFLYGGKTYKARLTETDAEDATKEWDRRVTALKSDRKAGRTVTFRVRACDGGACTTRKFTERVEWDD